MLNRPRQHAHRGRPLLASAARTATIAGVLLSALVNPGAVLAGPTGGQVVAGSGTIARPNADTTLINTVPAGQSVANIAGTSAVLAAFQVQGFFGSTLNRAALGRTVGLETTGLGELLYVDEGVFFLPYPYMTSIQAILLAALADPDFPADRRPDDPDDEQAWQIFFAGVLKDYVQSRYRLRDDAPAPERAAVDARIESEWRSLVAYFQSIRGRERAAILTGSPVPGSGG